MYPDTSKVVYDDEFSVVTQSNKPVTKTGILVLHCPFSRFFFCYYFLF